LLECAKKDKYQDKKIFIVKKNKQKKINKKATKNNKKNEQLNFANVHKCE